MTKTEKTETKTARVTKIGVAEELLTNGTTDIAEFTAAIQSVFGTDEVDAAKAEQYYKWAAKRLGMDLVVPTNRKTMTSWAQDLIEMGVTDITEFTASMHANFPDRLNEDKIRGFWKLSVKTLGLDLKLERKNAKKVEPVTEEAPTKKVKAKKPSKKVLDAEAAAEAELERLANAA